MFSEPERILFGAVAVALIVQVLKLFVPLVNGVGALLANAVFAALAEFVLFRVELTWRVLSIYFLIGLAAAGIHGTVTKIKQFPKPNENPTPSGTPAQNYDKMMSS